MRIYSTTLLILSFFAATTFAVIDPAEASLLPYESAEQAKKFCGNPKSLWEKHVCSVVNKVQPGCFPQKRYAYGKKDAKNIKGLIVLFHGFTSCPESYNFQADALQRQGFFVITPLTIGHGRIFNNCVDKSTCVNGDPLEELPETKEKYIKYVKQVNEIVQELVDTIPKEARSKDFFVGSLGLSLGGALAINAAIEKPDFYKKIIVVNGFFAITSPGLDRIVRPCENSGVLGCFNKLFSGFIDNLKDGKAEGNNVSSGFPLLSFLPNPIKEMLESKPESHDPVSDSAYMQSLNHLANSLSGLSDNQKLIPGMNFNVGWGRDCESHRKVGRVGFCNFQVKHLLAIHAFGQEAIKNSNTIKNTSLQIIVADVDGPSRNGFALSIGQNLLNGINGNSASSCIYKLIPGCNPSNNGNKCGVPHSCFNHIANLVTPPNNLYWEKNLFENTVGFFTGKIDSVGTADTKEVNPGICVKLDVKNPDSRYINNPKILQGLKKD